MCSRKELRKYLHDSERRFPSVCRGVLLPTSSRRVDTFSSRFSHHSVELFDPYCWNCRKRHPCQLLQRN